MEEGIQTWVQMLTLCLVHQVPVWGCPASPDAAIPGLWNGSNDSSLTRLPGGFNEMQAWIQGRGLKPPAFA